MSFKTQSFLFEDVRGVLMFSEGPKYRAFVFMCVFITCKYHIFTADYFLPV